MNEAAVASGVIANPAGLPQQGAVAQPLERDIGELQVDGATQNVLASRRDMSTDPFQQCICLGRSESANDPDRYLRPELLMQLPHQVDGLARHADQSAGPPVP